MPHPRSKRPRLSRTRRGPRGPQNSHFVTGLVTYLRQRSNRAPTARHEAAIDTPAPLEAAPPQPAPARGATSRAMRVLHLAQSDRGGGANKAAFRLHRALGDLGVASTFHPGRKLGRDPDVIPAWPAVGGRFLSTLAAWLDAHSLDAYPDRRGDVFSPVRFSYGRPRRRLVAASRHHLPALDCRIVPAPVRSRAPSQAPGVAALRPVAVHRRLPFPRRMPCLRAALRMLSVARQPRSRRPRRARFRRAGTRLCRARSHHRRAEPVDCRRGPAIGAVPAAPHRAHPHRHRRIGVPPDAADRGAAVARPSGRRPADPPVRRDGGDLERPQGLRSPAEGARPVRPQRAPRAGPWRWCSAARRTESQDIDGLPVVHVGKISDETRLARLYAAADVLIAPFIEDNLPNVVLEALACATPVVAFAAGGIPDAVVHERNGVLAPVGAADALAAGIEWVLDPARKPALDAAARQTAESRFDIRQCARRLSRPVRRPHRGPFGRFRLDRPGVTGFAVILPPNIPAGERASRHDQPHHPAAACGPWAASVPVANSPWPTKSH